jgi:hypothetical protein
MKLPVLKALLNVCVFVSQPSSFISTFNALFLGNKPVLTVTHFFDRQHRFGHLDDL